MTLMDRYILRSTFGLFAGLTLLALGLLLLARLIRLTAILSGAENAFNFGARLIANLVPHYLELALPGAFLVAVIVSVDRLSRSGEIVALLSSGVSLYRIARPLALLGGVLALISVGVSGFVQPLSRYNYRQIVFELQEGSIITAFQQQKFLQFKDRTIWTDSVDDAGHVLGQTFIIETAADGSRRFLTGATGILHADDSGPWVITLKDAMIGRVPGVFVQPEGDRFSMRAVDWQLPTTEGSFRMRGSDHRELTLPELISGSYLANTYEIDPKAAAADLHDRLSRAALLIVMPLLGVVLGLNLGRKARSGGAVIGIFVLLLVQKLLEFGMLQAERGVLPAWAGLWPVVGGIAMVAAFLFRQAATGRSWLPFAGVLARRTAARTVAGAGAS